MAKKQHGQSDEEIMEKRDAEIERRIARLEKKDGPDGAIDIDPLKGRDEDEEDETAGLKKGADPKTSSSHASAKAESKKKTRKEMDDEEEDEEDWEENKKSKKESKRKTKKEMDMDDVEDDEEEDEEEMESKKKTRKESKKSRKENDEEDEDEEEVTEEDEDEEDEDEEEMESKKSKKEEIDINVDEDVAALIDGEELSEEFKTKAATIFEAAVKSKIAKVRKQIRTESKKEQDERIETLQVEMNANVDQYLNYAVQEWMTENKLAVESGVRNEVTESFITGLKKLFEEHYIDVPEEKEDVFESLVVEVAELETKLDEQTEKHMETVKELNTYKAASVFKTVSEGMVDTDVEKFKELTEDVSYDTDEQYAEKLNVIKNSYFKSDKAKTTVDSKATAGTNNPVVDGSSDGKMDSVMSAIASLSKKQ